MNLAMYIGLVKKTLLVAREVCFGLLRRRNLVQMAACADAHADAHAQGGISPPFPLQPKTADAHKNNDFLQEDVLQYHYLMLQNVK